MQHLWVQWGGESFTITSVYFLLYREQREYPKFRWGFFSQKMSPWKPFENGVWNEVEKKGLRFPWRNRLNNSGSPEAPGKKERVRKCGTGSKYGW